MSTFGTNPMAAECMDLAGSESFATVAAEEFEDEAPLRTALGLAHDLNNFLTGTLLYCGLLRERLGPHHELASCAENIYLTSLRASNLATQFLNLGRSKPSGLEMCDVSESIAGMSDLLVRLVGSQVEVKYEIEPGVGRAAVKAVNLQRILLNLVLNARDAMPEGGRIRIRAKRSCSVGEVSLNESAAESSSALPLVLLEVSDTGHGMDAATRARVLRAFSEPEASRAGAGIGLSAVQDVIRRCGGTLELWSRPDCGTTIRLLIPSSRATAASVGEIVLPVSTKFCFGGERTDQ